MSRSSMVWKKNTFERFSKPFLNIFQILIIELKIKFMKNLDKRKEGEKIGTSSLFLSRFLKLQNQIVPKAVRAKAKFEISSK